MGTSLEREVHRPTFHRADGIWHEEGSGTTVFQCDSVVIDTLGSRVHSLWYDTAFVGDISVAFDALVLEPAGESNINLFLHAQTVDGRDVLEAGLSGKYEEYHERCQMYICTFTGYDPNGRRDANGELVTVGWTRVRRDPGFRLLSEDYERKSQVGVPYRVEVSLRGNRLRHAVNGETFHDVYDTEGALTGGRIAFRTFNTKLRISNFMIVGLPR